MFALSLIEHTLLLPPQLQHLPLPQAIQQELQRIFLDKVIPELGLCISVYDIRSIHGGHIVPGDGASTYQVAFRLVMFRPFVGEVLIGKIQSSDENGLKLSLGFFNDIRIPVHHLLQPYRMTEDKLWVWVSEEGEFSLDNNEEIIFRVHSVNYPPIPVEQEKDAKPFAPMAVTGGICDDGLGLLSWWDTEDAVEE